MSCSQRSLELEADIGGTVQEQTQWVLVGTQRGSPKCVYQVDLPKQFAEVLEGISKQAGWKVLYIRGLYWTECVLVGSERGYM